MKHVLISMTLALATPCVFAAGVCQVLPNGAVEAALEAKVTKTSENKGVVSEACTYMLNSAYGMGMFPLERYTRSIPPGSESQMLMMTGDDKDKIVEVPGLGEKAVMNTGTLDMIMRTGAVTYHYTTRGMPCEDVDKRDDETRQRCQNKRVTALSMIGKQLLGRK